VGLALPLALLGLLGIGVPIWLHRVRRQSLRDVALPTIQLLRRALVQRRRTLSFRDRPLLYARIALLALCALALSRPYLSRLVSYASERPIALALVLDDSMSMQRPATRGGTLFEAAQSRADRVLSELAPDSEATLVLAGNAARLALARSTDIASLREQLTNLQRVGARGTALSEALALATRELGGSQLPIKEALVLTDCAAHASADLLASSALHVRVECLPAREGPPNAYVSDLKLSQAPEVNAPATLTVALARSAEQGALEVAIEVDGQRQSVHTASMSDGAGLLEVPLPPALLRGARAVAARIVSKNALAEDDVRELLLTDRAQLSVLLVDGDPAPNQLDDELRFAALALSVQDGTHTAPLITRIDADGLDGADLAPFDVVVLANVRAPGAEIAARLERFVARGGGLLIAAGEHVDAFAYRGTLGNLLPAVVRSSAPADPPLALAKEPPLESLLIPERGRGLETAGTSKRLLLEPPVAPNLGLLSYADGTPLLVAGPHESGTVALLTTTLDDDWSDLPLTPGFLPLLTGLVRGLAAFDALPPGPHRAGSVLQARVPIGASAPYLVTPDGRRVDLDPKGAQLSIRDTAVTGSYRAFAVMDGQREQELEQLSFVVVPDLADSDLSLRLPRPEATRAAHTGAVRARGIESWFWLLFGLFAALEGALRAFGRRPAQAAPA
jgi:hypothetical protein